MAMVKLRGFTLIELLVVISIIGILSAIGLNAFEDSQQRARDSRRIQDLETIRKALQLYYNDNGKYPPSEWFYSYAGTSWIAALVPTYIKALPVDPINDDTAVVAPGACGPWATTTCYQYAYYSGVWCDGTVPGSLNATGQYILVARLESKPTDTSKSQRKYINNSGVPCSQGGPGPDGNGYWYNSPLGGLYVTGE